MKKTLSLLLTVIMLMGVIFAAIPVSAAASGTVKLSSGSLNVRKTASTSAAVVDKVYNGDKVTVLAKTTKSDGLWYKITTESDVTGYVKADYVTLGSSSGGSSGGDTSTTSSTGKVKTKTMKIYSTKSTKSTLLATANYGDTVTVVEMTSSSAWAKVTYNGKTGYCNKSSFELVSDGSGSSGTGDGKIQPAFTSYTKPSYTTYTSKAQVEELINYTLSNFATNFSFKVNSSNVSSILPDAKADVYYGYLLTAAQLKAQGLTN